MKIKVMLIGLLMFLLAGCKTITSLEVKMDKGDIYTGEKSRLKVIAHYEGDKEPPIDITEKAKCKSLDEHIAAIANGEVKAVKVGRATVQCEYEDKSKRVTIEVKQKVQGIKISVKKLEIQKGDVEDIDIYKVFTQGSEEPLKEGFACRSMDESIIKIKERSIYAVNEGVTNVVCNYKNFHSLPLTIKVNPSNSYLLGFNIAKFTYEEKPNIIEPIIKIKSHPPKDEAQFVEGFLTYFKEKKEKDVKEAEHLALDLISASKNRERYNDGKRLGNRLFKKELHNFQVSMYIHETVSLWSRSEQWSFAAGFAEGFGKGGKSLIWQLW